MNIQEGIDLVIGACNSQGLPLDRLDICLLRGALSGLTVEQTYIEYELKNACALGYFKTNRSPNLWKKLGIVFQTLGLISEADKLGRSNIWSYIFLLRDAKFLQPDNIGLRSPASEQSEANSKSVKAGKSAKSAKSVKSKNTSNSARSAQDTSAIIATSIRRELPELLEFYGRQSELAKLQRWILRDRIRVVTIVGIGGVGKKSLVNKFIEDVQGSSTTVTPDTADRNVQVFDQIIWRSLRHAPLIEDLLADIIMELREEQQPETNIPITNIDRAIAQLLELLRSHRCLLVLDDWEVLLDSNRTGVYHKKYNDYGKLLEQLATHEHLSCCVVISREIPIEIVRQERLNASVYRILQLKGLDDNAASQILTARGFSPDTLQILDLVQHYQGHPFALQIVAGIIREQFSSNIAEFLRLSTVVMDDALEELLEGQCQRLSADELEVIYWLALSSRPVTQTQIQNWRNGHTPSSLTISNLESLRRRSLLQLVDGKDLDPILCTDIDAQTTYFTLEPVVMKYITGRFVEDFCQTLIKLFSTKQISQAGVVRSHMLIDPNAPAAIQSVQRRLFLERILNGLSRLWISQAEFQASCQELLELCQSNAMIMPCYGIQNLQLLVNSSEFRNQTDLD